ncbi:MAG: TldD/PmbA family protein [Ignavibacteria bacterium]|jgi:predicted Zn-dependent protease
MILDEKEARSLLEKASGYSKADSISLNLNGFNSYNLRFALNSLSTNGYTDGLSLYITSNFGKKSGNVGTNKFDNDSIKEAIEKSEQIAKVSPDNNEFMSPLEPQKYEKGINFSQNTEKLTPEKRAEMVEPVLKKSAGKDLISAGFFEDEVDFTAILNSNGLFAYNKGTTISFSTTVRTKDGSGSSRVQKMYVDSNKLDINRLSDVVIDKSLRSVKSVELQPGKYTVILEPSAVADMIAYCAYFMEARPADEGRSFFSNNGKCNKIGELVVSPEINLYSDPLNTDSPSIPFRHDGIPISRTLWFEKGVLKNLIRTRYWAMKTGQPVVPFFSNLILDGTNKPLEEMISSTDRGILVTRFWYIRTVDPQTILLTGLTRDGLFEIRDGKITRPVKNFRFNESPINMLKNVLEIGKAENAVGSEVEGLQIFAPPLKVKDFNFSSISDAI